METSENIKSYYQDYISIYKDETDRLKQFKTFIDKTESDQLTEDFLLLGAVENPYPYYRQCDYF